MILDRYIAKTIILYTALVVLVVIGLDFLIGLLTELRDVNTGDYGFWQIMEHALLRLPYSIYQFSPMLMMLGTIIGLGLLASQQELMVMRTSGVSVRRLTRAVVMAAVVLILIASVLGEWIAPHANFLANKRKQSAENGGQAVATVSGVWIHEGNNFLHVDRVVGLHHLESVTRYEFDDNHHLLAAYYAKSMDFENNHWKLHDLVKTSFKNDGTYSQMFKVGSWNLAMNPNLLNVGLVQPDEMSLFSLIKYSHHLAENGLQSSRFQYEFWKRLFQPLATLVMMLLAVPFVLGAPRSVTMGRRMLIGVMVGFIFYMVNAFCGQLSVVYQFSPMISALLPTLIFGMLILLPNRNK